MSLALSQPIDPLASKYGIGTRNEALVKNALAIFEQDTAFGEETYADYDKPLVHYCTNVDGKALRKLGVPSLFPAAPRARRPQRVSLPTTAGEREGEAPRGTLNWEE